MFMLKYFKTRYSLAHPITFFNNKLFNHPIGISDKPISQICKFGHAMSWVIGFVLILRAILYKFNIINKKLFVIFNKIIFFTILTVSLLNMNAVVYLIPYFITEIMFFFHV